MGHRNAIAQNQDTEILLHKISHDKHHEKWGTADKTKAEHTTTTHLAYTNHNKFFSS